MHRMPQIRDRGLEGHASLQDLHRFAAEEGKRIASIDEDVLRLLTSYTWPGNVRQLENTIFRAVVLADGPELKIADFPQVAAHVEGFTADVPAAPAPADGRKRFVRR